MDSPLKKNLFGNSPMVRFYGLSFAGGSTVEVKEFSTVCFLLLFIGLLDYNATFLAVSNS